jgi:hypothetical protein
MSDYRKGYREFQREYFWTLPRALFAGIITLSCLCAVGFCLNYFGYASFSFFAPKYEAVRRDVMIQSRAYSEATTREIYRLKLQFQQAKTDDERATIAAMARHESQSFDRARLPADLRLFIDQIGG